jgi:CRP-like cAMP-binding protein
MCDPIAELGRWMTFARGELLYAVGDAPDPVFGREDGLLNVSVAVDDEEMVTIHRGTPGFWIGDSALLADARRGLSISAAAKSRVFRLPGNALRRHLVDHPEDCHPARAWAACFCGWPTRAVS